MPKFTTAVVTKTSNTVDLTEAKNFLASQPTGARINLEMEENETSRQVMRVLNASAKELGIKIFRIAATKTAVMFRIVNVRGPQKTARIVNEAKKTVTIKK